MRRGRQMEMDYRLKKINCIHEMLENVYFHKFAIKCL